MKGIEKLTSVRLAEVIAQKNAVPSEVRTGALNTQDHLGEPFVEALVSGGHISEWDLAKLVAEHFQLPFIMAGNYDISKDARDRIDPETLFKHTIVPLDVYGDAVTLVMPILTPFEVLEAIQSEHDCEVFPYVGLISENKTVLSGLFEGYKDWAARDLVDRVERKKSASTETRPDWMNIFDEADAKVRGSILDS